MICGKSLDCVKSGIILIFLVASVPENIPADHLEMTLVQ